MGNMEKPLTWVLAIGVMTLLAIANCDQLCDAENTSCKSTEAEIINDDQEILINEAVDVDSLVGAVLDSLTIDSAKVDPAD